MKIKIEKQVTLELDTYEVKQLQDLLEFARVQMDERKPPKCSNNIESLKQQHAINLGLPSWQELQNLESFMFELFEI